MASSYMECLLIARESIDAAIYAADEGRYEEIESQAREARKLLVQVEEIVDRIRRGVAT